MLQNKNLKIVFKTAFGLILFLWMAYSLYHQIRHQPNLKSTISELEHILSQNGLVGFALVLVLMIANWSIEGVKWRLLLSGTETFSFLRSLQSVLTGVAVSLITPNRIGEYMGRILYLRNVNKLQGVSVTIIGSFAQLIVTGFLGMVGLIYYIVKIQHSTWLYLLLAGSVVMCIGLTYFYFHLYKMVDWVDRFSFLRKIKTYIEVVKRFDTSILYRILFLSTLRYLVYTIQFLILLKLFLVEANSIDLIATIWLIFWAMAIVPTIAIAELGIRWETALFFMLPLSSNNLGIVSSTALLWLINLIIPALVGCLFVYKIKIYEDE